MGILIQLLACLCLLPYASSSDCAFEQEVDGDQHLSLMQQKVNRIPHHVGESGNLPGSEDPNMPVMMRPAEAELLGKFLATSKGYLEFGSGGSTIKALSYPNLQRIQVIESDPALVKSLKDRADVAEAEKTHRLQFHMVDIGPTTRYGFPQSTGQDWANPKPSDPVAQKKFSNYCNMKGIDMSNLDFVLVDGRFRVACFLQSLKHAAPDTHIGVHDYTPRRSVYGIIEKYADTVEAAEDLTIFRPKAHIDKSSLDNDISKYMVVPVL